MIKEGRKIKRNKRVQDLERETEKREREEGNMERKTSCTYYKLHCCSRQKGSIGWRSLSQR